MNTLFITKVKIFAFIKWSCWSFSTMLTIEPRMEPHLITYHSSIGFQLRFVTELGTSTLGAND